jgi:hypothetical protein
MVQVCISADVIRGKYEKYEKVQENGGKLIWKSKRKIRKRVKYSQKGEIIKNSIY